MLPQILALEIELRHRAAFAEGMQGGFELTRVF